ncbi:MAG: ATPase [Micrococcales bacterium]|nr:MAG: ATPase [Micrococcales bacterium]
MGTLQDLLDSDSDLDPGQLVSDMSFGDLVLMVPVAGSDSYLAVAQARPSTSATVLYSDAVGQRYTAQESPQVHAAYQTGEIQRDAYPQVVQDDLKREEAIPVRFDDRVIAVVVRHTNLASTRIPSRLELTYQRAADVLVSMVANGLYPTPGVPEQPRRGAPRVGDGFFWLDPDGTCVYASPNGVSTLHRMGFAGSLYDRPLSEIMTELLDDSEPVDESLPLVITGKTAWSTEVTSAGVTLSLRSIPLIEHGERAGAIMLSRDLTEIRHQQKELLSKQATIREVHHRVKNNLQTVTALLRLQARRMDTEEARESLEEAVRRVSTIAFVHETLAHGLEETLDFDQILYRGLNLTAGLATANKAPRPRCIGTFGEVTAEDATALALVLIELVSNAVEHGMPAEGDADGAVEVLVNRQDRELVVQVLDSGAGLPEDFGPGGSGLGTQIIEALVVGELRGHIAWANRPEGGCVATLYAKLRA